MALWHVPYLDESDPSTASLRAEAEALGAYPLQHGIALNRWGLPIDFTNPAAKSFWQKNLARYTSHGIEGFKLDYGEDVVPGLTADRNAWVFADGSDERTMHGRYQLGYHDTYAEMLPPGGGFLLCRHATIGDQVHGPIIWPGDLDATFAKAGDVVADSNGESYVAVGGLPASVVAGLGLGVSGFPF
jgi:alpha-D-xyloside xylohydrolase